MPVLVATLQVTINNSDLPSSKVMGSLFMLTLGPMLASQAADQRDASFWGMLSMGLAVSLGALKAVTLHDLVKSARKDMGMVNFLFWLEAGIVMLFLPMTLASDELERITAWKHFEDYDHWLLVTLVAIAGGFRAYTQNLMLKYNSALSMVTANVFVQAATIIISLIVFQGHQNLTPKFVLGLMFSITGYGLYVMFKYHERTDEISGPDSSGSAVVVVANAEVGSTNDSKVQEYQRLSHDSQKDPSDKFVGGAAEQTSLLPKNAQKRYKL